MLLAEEFGRDCADGPATRAIEFIEVTTPVAQRQQTEFFAL
jgi:hypothetical protein